MITFGITVSNEDYEFQRLLDGLIPFIKPEEKIVILADENKITQKIKDICFQYNLEINYFNFQNNFSDFKNHLISLVKTKYLFQLDADEQISPSLLILLRDILNTGVYDCIWLPRINIINGHTDQDIADFNWNKYGEWIAFPDYQIRVMEVNDSIHWRLPVHEEVIGYNNRFIVNYLDRPELFSILHVKNIEKQRKQNKLYDSIS